jgi:hypothetical protein
VHERQQEEEDPERVGRVGEPRVLHRPDGHVPEEPRAPADHEQDDVDQQHRFHLQDPETINYFN